MKIYLLFRPLAIATLITYLFLRNNSDARWEYDLVLFNLVALLAALSIALSPKLLRRADEAMYEAKRSKLGVVSWHDQLGTSGSRL